MADNESVAANGSAVVQVMVPNTRVLELQPVIETPPFWKLIVPVGVTPPPDTVAVRTVLVPTLVGDGAAVNEVEEVPGLTTSEALPVEEL
jgi:hypothetical protein